MKEIQGLMISGEEYLKLVKTNKNSPYPNHLIFKRFSEKVNRLQTRKMKKTNPEKPGEYDSISISDLSVVLISSDGTNIPKQTRWLKCTVGKTGGSWEQMFLFFEPHFLSHMQEQYKESNKK